MESKKPPSPPAQSEEEESAKEQDEESGEGERGSQEDEESASEYKELQSAEEERSQREEFEVGENIYESRIPHAKPPTRPPTRLNKMFSAHKKIVTPSQSPANSEEEDEEGGDDEELEFSTHSPSASDFVVKFITPTKPTSKDSNSTSKRPLEDQRDDEKHLRSEKKYKGKADEPKTGEPSAVLATNVEGAGRKWSNEDVKCLLDSIIKFKTEKGLEPSTNMNALSEYVKGKLQRKSSRSQIYEKIRKLKNKISKFEKKLEKGGDGFVFFSANEFEIFELSQSIWGGESDGGTTMNRANKTVKRRDKVVNSVKEYKKEEKKKKKKKKNAVKPLFRDDANDDFQSKYPLLAKSFDLDSGGSFLKENMSLIGHEKAMELEGEWKKMREAEVEHSLKRSELMKEHCYLVLEGMKEKNN